MFHFNGHTTGTCPHRLKSYNILKRPHHVHCRVYMCLVGYCILFRCDFCKPTIGVTSCLVTVNKGFTNDFPLILSLCDSLNSCQYTIHVLSHYNTISIDNAPYRVHCVRMCR